MKQQRYPSTPPEIQVRVDLSAETDCSSSRGRTVVHPVSMTPPLFTTLGGLPLVNKQVKHFKKWFPWLIPAFVIANVVVFIVTMYINDCRTRCLGRFLGRFSFQNFQDNPLLGPSSITLQKMGALDKRKVVDDHQGWRLITSMWLHGGVFHLLVNMVGLFVIGIRLELEFGFVRIGMLYVISGFGGAILSSLFLQLSISVGASGAVFGLLGAMLSELIINWTIYDNELSWFITLVGIIIVNLVLGVLPHVDNFAHIGGFITGFLLGFVFLIRPQLKWITQRQTPADSSSAHNKPKYKTYQCILWVLSLILLVVGIVIGLVSLLRGFDANKYCYWCHYLTCVPTPSWKCGNPPIFCSLNQNGDQLNITCSSNGKSAIYLLPDATIFQINRLCSVVCN